MNELHPGGVSSIVVVEENGYRLRLGAAIARIIRSRAGEIWRDLCECKSSRALSVRLGLCGGVGNDFCRCSPGECATCGW